MNTTNEKQVTLEHIADILNRRATVENLLLEAAAGKRPLPDANECRRLAHQLGVPVEAQKPH